MNWFDDLKLRYKLLLNFFLSGGVLIAAVAFCILQIRAVGADTEEISKNRLPSVQQVGEISQLRLRYRVRSLEYMLPGSAEEKAKLEDSLKKLDGEVMASLKAYEKLVSGDDEARIYREADKAAIDYRAAVEEAIALVRAGKEDEAQQLRRTKWVATANHLRDQTDALVKLNSTGAAKASAKAENDVASATRTGVVALVVGIILALTLSFLISRRIEQRLHASVAAARRIAAGDLRGTLPPASRDEVGELITSVSNMQESLRSAMNETLQGAARVLEASTALNGAVAQIDAAASVQSSAASAIAANVEELTVSINHVADSTGEAARLVAVSDRQAGEGCEAIGRLVGQIGQVAEVVENAAQQIGQLKDDSEKISRIVAVIREIADQTNLLALNAAIEAARAGEQGRGFAVVADEVRKLAERTAHSTVEISNMVSAIQQSTTQVVSGIGRGVELVEGSVSLATQVGSAIGELREMAQNVSGIVVDLDTSLREQATASNDVAVKIEQIATKAEEFSGIAHATSSASDSLSSTAHDMQRVVGRFQI
jgi:methyl-accepting chemotaxis protein